jgi:hypothetical protein
MTRLGEQMGRKGQFSKQVWCFGYRIAVMTLLVGDKPFRVMDLSYG